MVTQTPPPDTRAQLEHEDANADLEALRDILRGADQQRLEELSRRVRERQLRADDVAEVLPEAFLREFDRAPQRLTEAVRRPIEHTLREAVRNDPRPIADAIFPIIGPAIRRYIAASMRALAESLSRTIERGLSPRRQLAWRFKAWRAGVSFGDYVLQRTFVYRVEHVYLIQKGSGLLIGEAHHGDSPAMDGDAVSGLLAALQSFVLDSFEVGGSEQIDNAQVGDYTVWAIHGPHAMLACAIRGVAPTDLRARLNTALESIHLHFGREVEGFDGTAEAPPALEQELENCLYMRRADDEDEAGDGRIGWSVWLVLAGLVLMIGRWVGTDIDHRLATARLTELLANTPGVVVTDVARERQALTVHGLRDPLAPAIADLAEAANVGRYDLVDLTEPYQSLEPELVLQRLSRALDQPDSVKLSLDGTVLRVAGVADSEWVAMVDRLVLVSPAIDEVDSTLLRVSDETLLDTVRRLLQPPSQVRVGVREAVLEVRGVAPIEWVQRARGGVAGIAGLRGVDVSGVQVAELIEAQAIAERLADSPIYFERGSTRYGQDGAQAVASAAQDVRRLLRLAQALGREASVAAVGSTDSVGNAEDNRALRVARGERVREDLLAAGVPPAAIFVRDAGEVQTEGAELRRVEFSIEMNLDPVTFGVTP